MSDLLELRAKLDAIDPQIAEFFFDRMKVTEEIARDKLQTGKEIFDPAREKEKMDAVGALAENAFDERGIREVFRQIMAISRKRQLQLIGEREGLPLPGVEIADQLPESPVPVVYQGVEGAYSHAAMKRFFGEETPGRAVETWREAAEQIASGEAEYAVLPIENSTAGSVSDIYDLLLDYSVYIVGEEKLEVDHVLLGVPGASLFDISTVYSHPQALAQCREYLDQHPDWQKERWLNTAVAAEKVSADGNPSQAAIASRLAGERFGLAVLAEHLTTEKNTTRFIVISPRPIYRRDAAKISLCFGLPHTCGTLYTVLSHFLFNDLNLTKIESRPIPEKPFEYRFFVDFEGNLSDPAVQNAIRGIRAEAEEVTLLGNY